MKHKLYGAPGCPLCMRAKRFLEDNNVEYDYLVVGEDIDENEYMDKFNHRSIPILETIDGEVVLGFNDFVYKNKLNINK